MSKDLSYRINTNVGKNEESFNIDFQMNQTYDMFEILSLKLTQKSLYSLSSSNTGVIVGRVLAGSKDFGIPNAKVSVFIPYENIDDVKKYILYHYESSTDANNGIRYNLLPEDIDEICHQDVGTFYNKEFLLDNKDLIEIFEKYYKYTTTTNNAGDYMIYGVPIGTQTLHVDIDLSDIGILSQRPRDMVNKGYNINQFESPNKFKKSKNLNQLVQIYTQDKGIKVFPFWGDTTDDETNASITRCDIKIDYEFEPTCVFMGSIVTDGNGNAISKKCVADEDSGKMSDLITGEGMIEMIRKTPDGKVQEFNIKGGRLIDSDGTWCYQIPMNLDYVRTDEYGNMIPTDNPDSGIPTRARVRFRISIDEIIDNESAAKKRARFLVPNNPRYDAKRYPEFTKSSNPDADYEFGSFTKDESFCDLFMNKVYTVKSYIPRIQKTVSPNKLHFTGIKAINHYGANNPMPYNNIQIKFNITFRILCIISELFVGVINFINRIFSRVYSSLIRWAGMGIFIPDLKQIFMDFATSFQCISVTGLCDDGNEYFPGCNNGKKHDYGALYFLKLKEGENIYGVNADGEQISKISNQGEEKKTFYTKTNEDVYSQNPITSKEPLFNCIESGLSEHNEIIKFNFQNDWINGVLYAPMWYRHIKSKRKFFFNLIKLKAKDEWCSADIRYKGYKGIKLYHTCALPRNFEIEKDSNGTIIRKTLKKLPNSNNVRMNKFHILNQEIKNVKLKSQDETNGFGFKSHKRSLGILKIENGIIKSRETKYGKTVFYYKAIEYNRSSLLMSRKYIDYELKEKEDKKPKNERNEENYTKIYSNTKNDYVKLLFATDIVLLGSLNENDIDGTPQFFKKLPSTTYNMPNTLLTEEIVDKEIEINNINGLLTNNRQNNLQVESLDKLNTNLYFSNKSENVSEGYDKKYTDTTGADWGNHGLDQNFGDYYSKFINENFKSKYKFDTEILDDGGLFYGINCNFAFVKPKSSENLKRICEYGVQLDSNIEVPDLDKIEELRNDPNLSNKNINNDEIYKILVPDGYISYDEIYDHDGRSMFATMNSNYLKTRVNPMTGFKVYDFDYTYIQNFDGSMQTLMKLRYGRNGTNDITASEHWGNLSNGEKPTYLYNYVMEELDENYIKFRYGEDLYYYLPSDGYNMVLGSTDRKAESRENNSINFITFPRYENSFYFYFGLKSGSTAIDKFRTQFYSECTSDETEKPTFDIEVESNSWCSNSKIDNNNLLLNNGYVAIKTKGLSKPYTLKIIPLTNTSTEECFKENIENDNIYIGINENLDADVKSKLYTYSNIELDIKNSNDKIQSLNNGKYIFTFIDCNGIEFDNEVEVEQDYLTYKYSVKDFTESNEVLISVYGNNQNIANQNESSRSSLLDRKIGGYISINNIMNNGNLMGGSNGEQYQIIVRPSNPSDISPQLGEWDGVCVVPFEISKTLYEQGVYDKDLVPFANTGNKPSSVNGLLQKYDNSCIIGVPKGDIYYDIIITQICPKGSCSCDDPSNEKFWRDGYTQNSVKQTVLVSSPKPIHFLINDVDYRFISLFETGWYAGIQRMLGGSLLINKRIDGTVERNASSWLNLENIMNTRNIGELYAKPIFCPTDNIDYENVKIYFNSLNQIYTLKETNNINNIKNILFSTLPIYVKEKSYKNSILTIKYYRLKDTFNFLSPYEEINNEDDLQKICYYNWPINYCYYKDMNESIWNNLSETEKLDEINKINLLIQKRLEISRKVRASFSKTLNSNNITLKLENQNDFNNKFLISYVEDTLINNKPSFVNFSDSYHFLEEDSLRENYLPTIRKKITSEESGDFIYDYTNMRGIYKKPYYVGCISTDKTFPEKFSNKNYEERVMTNMFGVHIIDRPINSIFRNWVFSEKLQKSIRKVLDVIEDYSIVNSKENYVKINDLNSSLSDLNYNSIIKFNSIEDAQRYLIRIPNDKYKILFLIKDRLYYYQNNNFKKLTDKNGYENITINLLYKDGNNYKFIPNPYIENLSFEYTNEESLYENINRLQPTTLYSLGHGTYTYYKKNNGKIDKYISNIPQFLWVLPSKIWVNIHKNEIRLDGKPMSFLIGKINNGVENNIFQKFYNNNNLYNLITFNKNICGDTLLKFEKTEDKTFNKSLAYSPYYVEETNNLGIIINKNISKEEIPDGEYIEPVDTLYNLTIPSFSGVSYNKKYKKLMYPLMDNYNFDTENNRYGFNALPIEYKTQNLEINESSGFNMNINIYGDLELNILENSLDTMDEGSTILYLGTNSVSSENVYYISSDIENYTLNRIIEKNGDYNYLTADSYDEYGILKLEEDFNNMEMIENSNEITINKNIQSLDEEVKRFIVVKNGISYTLSPILDFNFYLKNLNFYDTVFINQEVKNIKIKYKLNRENVNFINEKCILHIIFKYEIQGLGIPDLNGNIIQTPNIEEFIDITQEIDFSKTEMIGNPIKSKFYISTIYFEKGINLSQLINFDIKSVELIDPYGLKHKCILN